MITQPVRWDQYLDPSPADSTVLPSQQPCPRGPPPPGQASSLLFRIQPPFRGPLGPNAVLARGRGAVPSLPPSLPFSLPHTSCPPSRHPSQSWAPYMEVEGQALGLDFMASPLPALESLINDLSEPPFICKMGG